jgi:hypothetical protein
MEIVNLLKFLNSAKTFYTLDYATCDRELVNFLNLITKDEQFIPKIDLGIIYVKPRNLEQFTIVDGLSRFLSLSLLLHAICECYKKTSIKNDNAIRKIRSKYLLNGESNTKLKLPSAKEQEIFEKILFGEKLSGHEKEHSMFKLLHSFWTQIKEEKLQASHLFKMLGKIEVMVVSVDSVPPREIYYNLNKGNRKLNQLLLIQSYLKNLGLQEEWDKIKAVYGNVESDITLFFNDFFATKFNWQSYSSEFLYESFVNYFETLLQFIPEDVLISKIRHSAELYKDLLNVNISNTTLKHSLINIKMHGGEDTYAYILSIYEDYVENNLSEATFLEILSTIDDYLIKRTSTPNNVSFNELISYLNAFITCK